MRITLSKQIVPDLHAEIRRLVRLGFEEVNWLDVEVHVKGRPPTVTWRALCLGHCPRINWTPEEGGRGHEATRRTNLLGMMGDRRHAPITRVENAHSGMAGRAFGWVPYEARVAKGTRWLVTLKIPHDPRLGTYPRTWTYKKQAGPMTYETWQERLVHVAAHEARHILQFKRGEPRSEVVAEEWARAAQLRFRAMSRSEPSSSTFSVEALDNA